MHGQSGFLGFDRRLPRLSDLRGQLLPFAEVVDFEPFYPQILKALTCSCSLQLGTPAIDPVRLADHT